MTRKQVTTVVATLAVVLLVIGGGFLVRDAPTAARYIPESELYALCLALGA